MAEHTQALASSSWWRDAFRRLLRNRAAAAGLAIVAVFALLAIFAPWVDHRPPTTMYGSDHSFEGPSRSFWLGTDQLGRDQYSRLVHGARISLAIGVLSQAIALAIGLAVGMAAGLGGKRIDGALMRLTDVAYAFPDLLLIILLVSMFGSSLLMIVLAIGLVSWTTIARLVRGQVLSLREEEFVLGARAMGASPLRLAWQHLLPNLLGPVIVTVAFGIPAAIFAEAALAYLGLGLSSPGWGLLAVQSREAIWRAPYLPATACLTIALATLSFTFIGDGLRDALDPRAQRSRRGPNEPDATLPTAVRQPPAERQAA